MQARLLRFVLIRLCPGACLQNLRKASHGMVAQLLSSFQPVTCIFLAAFFAGPAAAQMRIHIADIPERIYSKLPFYATVAGFAGILHPDKSFHYKTILCTK